MKFRTNLELILCQRLNYSGEWVTLGAAASSLTIKGLLLLPCKDLRWRTYSTNHTLVLLHVPEYLHFLAHAVTTHCFHWIFFKKIDLRCESSFHLLIFQRGLFVICWTSTTIECPQQVFVVPVTGIREWNERRDRRHTAEHLQLSNYLKTL